MGFFTIVGLIICGWFGLCVALGLIYFICEKIHVLYMFYVKKKVKIDTETLFVLGLLWDGKPVTETVFVNRKKGDRIVW